MKTSQPRAMPIAQSETGNCAAIDVKISSDMPLPMPRSVMSSPIHMMRPVPAVIVMTMSRIAYQASFVMSCEHSGAPGREQRARTGDGDERRRLEHAERDGEVARVLREARLARLALLVEGLEVGDDHAQQLHDDRRGDVGHDAQREDRQLEQCTAREEVDQLVEAGCPLARRETRLHVPEVHERCRDEGAEPEQGDDAQGESDLAAKIRRAEDPPDGVEHSSSCSSFAERVALVGLSPYAARACRDPRESYARSRQARTSG